MTVVLENGQYYSVYGETGSNGAFYAYGLVQGSGSASNGSFSSTDAKDFYKDQTAVAASLSASYSPNVNFNGTVAGGTTPSTFTSAPLAASLYNYKTAANLADITGSWPLMDNIRDELFALNITPTGTVTGSSWGGTSTGCSLNGAIAPRPSGTNVFNVSLTFGPAPCATPGLSVTGVAIEFLLTNGKHELLIAGTDSTRANATALAGAR